MKIQERWKWAAMDSDEKWHLYEARPKKHADEWRPPSLPLAGKYTSVPNGLFSDAPQCDWQNSLHQIIDGEMVKYCDAPEPPAVTRAREILEECGIVDVQGTPVEQLRPLVELVKRMHDLEKLCGLRTRKPDAAITIKVGKDGQSANTVFNKDMLLPNGESTFHCYLVPK